MSTQTYSKQEACGCWPLLLLTITLCITACQVDVLKDGPKMAYHGDFLRSSTKESRSIELNGVGKATDYTENADETSVAKMGLGTYGVAKTGDQLLKANRSSNALKATQAKEATKQTIAKIPPTVTQPVIVPEGSTAVFPQVH